MSLEDDLGVLCDYNKLHYFLAGHIPKIEEALAAMLAAEKSNPAYLCFPLEKAVNELKNAYVYFCFLKGIKPNKDIISVKTMFDREEEFSSHCIGTALFSVIERMHGMAVYREALEGAL